MKITFSLRKLLLAALALASTPAMAYTMESVCSEAKYMAGDDFTLTFKISAYTRESETWDLLRLADNYYVVTQNANYVGLSKTHDGVSGYADGAGSWAAAEQDDDGVYKYTSDGYLYSWISKAKDASESADPADSALYGIPQGMILTISSTTTEDGVSTSQLDFSFKDGRKSSITLNNVYLDATKIDFADSIVVEAESFIHKNATYDFTYTINTGETYTCGADVAHIKNYGTLQIKASGYPRSIENMGSDAAVELLSSTGEVALTLDNHVGTLAWRANVETNEEGKTTISFVSDFIAGCGDFSGNVTVHDGTILENYDGADDNYRPFGAVYTDNSARVITVKGGGTLDLNGSEFYHHVVLEKDAILANTQQFESPYTVKNLPVVDLDGDAYVQAEQAFGMLWKNYGVSDLNLNGHTLTKTGKGEFFLINTTANAGTIDVQEGTLAVLIPRYISGNLTYSNNGKKRVDCVSDISQVDVKLAAGAELVVSTLYNAVEDQISVSTVKSVTGEGSVRLVTREDTGGKAALKVEDAQIILSTVDSSESADTEAVITRVSMTANGLRGYGASALMKDVWMLHPLEAASAVSLADMELQNVHFESASATALSLSNVSIDADSSFSVGLEGSIVLSNAVLKLGTLSPLDSTTLTIALSDDMFSCSALTGSLNLITTASVEELREAGYTRIQVTLGSVTTDYTGLVLGMNDAFYKGIEGNVATFSLIPEPTTATLGLIALSALAARRRRR